MPEFTKDNYIYIFFLKDTAPTEIYTLPLHAPLPIYRHEPMDHTHIHVHDEHHQHVHEAGVSSDEPHSHPHHHEDLVHSQDRKSTRLNSSHLVSRMPSSA